MLLTALGQDCKENFLGSKTLYKAHDFRTPAPAHYSPVFINHVGRHGARHLTSDVNTSAVYRLLVTADSAGALTTDGKLLEEKILRLEKVEKKNIKSISVEGKAEQQGLAVRMYAGNQTVFNSVQPVINIDYTKEIRTLQTSEAFLNELRAKINEPAVTRQINDTTLRFYDLSPAYLDFKQNGPWIKTLQQIKKKLGYPQLAMKISQRFFTPNWLAHLTEKDQDDFVSGIFGFIAIFYSIQKEIAVAGYKSTELDMQSFLTCAELSVLSTIDNAEDFLEKGPGTDVNDIQVTVAVPLLADFIKTTDAFIRTKTVQANLRFSHAETIAPFAALLSFTTASVAVKNTTRIHQVWNADKVIPLSANIQWILYQKKGTENYLVKFLLNEKEVAVKGLATKTFPYYNWNVVRQFYSKKMEQLHLRPGQDYFDYLQRLK